VKQNETIEKLDRWAVITGSTSGIGNSFCQLLALEGYNLITVSRDSNKMNSDALYFSKTFGVEVEVVVADLAIQEQIHRVNQRLLQSDKNIEVLVNNAGFGINSTFLESPLSNQTAMINCMIMAPMELTHSIGNKMKSQSKGFVINVSSVAGFMAGSTYCSAKSWLNVFSESIHQEFKNFGINVHVICPGFTKTNFHKRCKQDVSGVPNYFWLSPERVAKRAWMQVQRGKTMSIPAIHYKLLVGIHQFAPRAIVIFYGKIAKAFLARK